MKRRAVMLVGALGLALSACGGSSHPIADGPTVSTTTNAVRSGVSAHIEVPNTSVSAGQDVQGVLVVDNETGDRISLGSCGFNAQLTNAQHPFENMPTPQCDQLVSTGVSRLPFTVHTTDLRPGLYRLEYRVGIAIADPPLIQVSGRK